MKDRAGRLLNQRLLALFAAGWLLFSYPLLRLWLSDQLLWGLVPLLPLALFAAWAVLIVLLAWMLEGRPAADERRQPDDPQ